MSLNSLHDQQRRVRRLRERWRDGRIDDRTLRRALVALSNEYEDAANWHVREKGTQTLYYNLARNARQEAAGFSTTGEE